MTDTNLRAAVAATRSIVLPEICTVEDLARHLRASNATVRALIRRGVLPGRKIGRRWIATRADVLAAVSVELNESGPRLLGATESNP